MSDISIDCTECGATIELTSALAAPLLEAERRKMRAEANRELDSERAAIAEQTRLEVETALGDRLKASEAAIADRDAKLEAAKEAELAARVAKAEAEQAKRDIELTVRQRVDAEKNDIELQAAERAHAEAAAKLKAVEDALAEKDAKLKVAQDAELEALRMKREFEEAKREVELTVARRIDEECNTVREQVLKERDETNRLHLAEKDAQMQAMRETIEDLRRKGNAGSQQLAGEVLEVDLLDVLHQAFPGDSFERVGKGQRGGDVVHTARNAAGYPCGRILWESKRTKNWSDTWLPKLREDQRHAKCDLAALATESLPDGTTHFDQVGGVWVSGLPTVVPMASALRHAMIEIATARRAAAGADSKKDRVYAYLTGSEFRARVCGAIEPLFELRADLERERRLMTKQWATREKQIDRFGLSLAGMYGDLHGIVGASLPVVDGLVLPELDGPSDTPALSAMNPDPADQDQEE